MKRQRQGVKDLQPAPGELRLVQAFLNTVDREAGTDDLSDPRALADWLVNAGLLPAETELDEADWRRAIDVREGWRSLLTGAPSDSVTQALDQALETAVLRPRHGADGEVALQPAPDGLDGALGRLSLILLQAQSDGTRKRLKVCPSSTCRGVFYDLSTNLSRRWCRPRCGNRLSSLTSKRRSRSIWRQGRNARRRDRERAAEALRPADLPELVDDPELKRLARLLRQHNEQG